MQLVELVDRVLDLLEADPLFRFTLDGQLATVDDYLEIRPEAEARIRALVEEGRLAVGPWQVLPDEFLVSGETLVRNLETGWRRGEQVGGPMPVGYLPDMFGHAAQMPQILHRAGIAHAAVWRGVPAAVSSHAFRWEAPDGSSVRAEYLVGGYWNAAYLFAVPDRLAAKVEIFHETVRGFFDGDPPLAMYGTDHAEPLPEVVELVERMNEAQSRYRVELLTLADYFARADEDAGRDRWRGELRSSARANMLPGVNSARIDLKAACGRAERLLERYAEPLDALYGDRWADPFLSLAWKRLIENSAHDSICGCSHDEVSEQVLVRYSEVVQIAEGVIGRATRRAARSVPAGAFAVVNPSPRERTALVELEARVPESWEAVALELPDGGLVATQERERSAPLLYTAQAPGRALAEPFRLLHGRELFRRWVNGYRVDEVDGVPRLTLEVDDEPDPLWLDMDELKREVEIEGEARPDDVWRVEIAARPHRRLVANVPAPALGWTTIRPVAAEGAREAGVRVEGDRLTNGLVEVRVEEDGTLAISADGVALRGVGRLVDGGDFGDSYNYAPPAVDRVVDRPESVEVFVRAPGPIVGELAVVRAYRWPSALVPESSARSRETALVPVTTSVALRPGEPFVRVAISFENPCSDHRLRFHVPLAVPADRSFAEGQFAVVERGLDPEGGHGEVPLPTFPASGFVDVGGVAVLLDHVLEYEVLGGRELALTVLRAIGLVTRNENPYRAQPAGPEIPIPAGQCRRPWRVAFALYPHAGSWADAGVLEQAEAYRHPFIASPGTGEAEDVASGGGLEVRGDGIVLSSLRRRGEWLELRLVCERPAPSTAVVAGGLREAREADLLGRAGRALRVDGGTVSVDLGAWEIRTLQLRR